MIKLTQPKFWHKKNIISYLMLPLSVIYFILCGLRKIKILLFGKIKLPAKLVVCVGNLTAGGSGKTQVVIWLCKKLSHKYKILVISKGFGGTFDSCEFVNSDSSAYFVGEEARQIFDETGVMVLVTKDIRIIYEKILSLSQNLRPDLIITDDFMQNPHFHKDIKITVIDGNRNFENRFLIPAGSFREIIEFHKTDMCITLKNKCEKVRSDIASKICCNNKYEAEILVRRDIDDKIDKSRKYCAFAGIGNFDRFLETLRGEGICVSNSHEFPDHYRYTKNDLFKLIEFSENNDLRLITTRKDYTKILHVLSDQDIAKFSVIDVEINLENAEKFVEFIEKRLD
jgi:tetraacyldisaccharide 4'-kinase